jgi:hypothetical protein
VDFLVGLWVLAMLVALYFVPTIVAFNRNVVNKWSVAVINGFLGWTLLGWVVALAMALRTATEPKPGTQPDRLPTQEPGEPSAPLASDR